MSVDPERVVGSPIVPAYRAYLAAAVCSAAVLAPSAAFADTEVHAADTTVLDTAASLSTADHPHSNVESAARQGHRASRLLERQLKKHQPVTVDVGHDYLWSDKGAPNNEFQYKTNAPLIFGSGDNAQAFAIGKPVAGSKELNLIPIPDDAARVDDTSHLTGINYGDIVPDGGQYTVVFDRKNRAWVRPAADNSLTSEMRIGHTVKAPQQYVRSSMGIVYDGKRFASTAPSRQITRSRTIEGATRAAQLYFNQDNVWADTSTLPTDNGITYSIPDASDLEDLKMTELLAVDEYAKYPLDWMEVVGLRTIYFVKNLKDAGYTVPGVAVPLERAVYIDIGNSDNFFTEEVVHHETAHILYPTLVKRYPNFEQTWDSFNPPDFEGYMGSGLNCYMDAGTCDQIPEVVEGFPRGYDEYSRKEDEADTEGYSMTSGLYKDFLKRAKTDPYLARKINYDRMIMTDISPEMGGDYLRRVNRQHT